MARILLLLAAIAAGLAQPVSAQTVSSTKTLDPKGYYVQLQAPCTVQPDKSCVAVTAAAAMPVTVISGASKQEAFTLISNNTPAAAQAVYGGDYIFSVVGTFGGASVQLQALGPDGTTYINIGTPVTASGTSGVRIGSYGVMRATVTGGTPSGISASLSRIPS